MPKIIYGIIAFAGNFLLAINILVLCLGGVTHALMAPAEPMTLIPFLGFVVTWIVGLIGSQWIDPNRWILHGGAMVLPPLIIYYALGQLVMS